ncbi:hypothetical protein QAD02_009267 [Eretmocerus hayati]|uniref:Uncharacterized protein n=1 Tax=Eretmocerus hayati TaxID=131215 RepID=A0ACC2N973_9HYME|nr:hypothetical protein QAD02_009267 [Eretmocerus hayati]
MATSREAFANSLSGRSPDQLQAIILGLFDEVMSLKSLIGASAQSPSGTPSPPALNPALPSPPSSSSTSSSGTEQTAPSHSPMDTNTQEDGFETVTSRKTRKRRRQQNFSSAEDSDSDSSDEESSTAGRSPPPIVICDNLS